VQHIRIISKSLIPVITLLQLVHIGNRMDRVWQKEHKLHIMPVLTRETSHHNIERAQRKTSYRASFIKLYVCLIPKVCRFGDC